MQLAYKESCVMNGIKYLLDTCFILRYFGQEDDVFQIIQTLDLQSSECAYSVISQMEILGYPLNDIDEQNLKLILSDFERLAVTDEVIDETIRLRKQYKIKLPDCMILATANVHNLQLLTLDKKLQKYI